jgi:hypothetical protein
VSASGPERPAARIVFVWVVATAGTEKRWLWSRRRTRLAATASKATASRSTASAFSEERNVVLIVVVSVARIAKRRLLSESHSDCCEVLLIVILECWEE